MNKYVIELVKVGVVASTIEQAVLIAQKNGWGVSEINFTEVKEFSREIKVIEHKWQ